MNSLAHYLFHEPALNLVNAGKTVCTYAGKYVNLFSPHLARPEVDEQGLNPR